MKPLVTLALLVTTAAMLLAACGGDSSKSSAPPGSPENPLVAKLDSAPEDGRSNEATAEHGTKDTGGSKETGEGAPAERQTKPGYEGLVNKQSSRPRSRFSPCNLVSKGEAEAILDSTIEDPLEAPQGPTCIYRPETGKGFITVAVQSVSFTKLRRLMGQPRQVDVSGRSAYCGQYGQAMLYLPLQSSRVLTIAGPCPVASRFAAKAVQRLKA